MNEKLNLVEILKDCLPGTKLYSPLAGEVELSHIDESREYPIMVLGNDRNFQLSFTKEGLYHTEAVNGECVLFPSKEVRTWSNFKPKKPKFDPKTLMPFDRVLVRDDGARWECDLFSRIDNGVYRYICVGDVCEYCIPYNDDTKHLVGTTDEAPEFYRYCEE